MATIVKGYTFGSTEQVTNAKLHSLVDSATISGIVNADIDSAAAIATSKLAAIDGSKLSGLANIAAGAGVIPSANLPTDTYAAKGANSDITSLSACTTITGLTTPLSVAQGGTGATSAADARTNLGITTQGGFGSWVDKSTNYGAQQATTDGIIVASFNYLNQDGTGMYIYTDASSNPTTVHGKCILSGDITGTFTVTVPVKKNDYWKIALDGNNTVDAFYWIPSGS